MIGRTIIKSLLLLIITVIQDCTTSFHLLISKVIFRNSKFRFENSRKFRFENFRKFRLQSDSRNMRPDNITLFPSIQDIYHLSIGKTGFFRVKTFIFGQKINFRQWFWRNSVIFIDFDHVINMYFYQWESLCLRKSTLLPPNIKRDIKWGAYLYNLQVPFTKTSILQILNSSQIRWLITMTSFSMNHTVWVIWRNYFWKNLRYD